MTIQQAIAQACKPSPEAAERQFMIVDAIGRMVKHGPAVGPVDMRPPLSRLASAMAASGQDVFVGRVS